MNTEPNKPTLRPRRHLPTIESFDHTLRSGDPNKIRQLYVELHAIASSLAEWEYSSQLPPKRTNDYSDPDPTERDSVIPLVFTVTYGGHLWRWNCGWQEYDPKTLKPFGPFLGHTQFRKKPIAHQKHKDWVYLNRPFGPWRRIVRCRMYHDILRENVSMIFSDGFQCIVETNSGERLRVFLSNLTEVSTPIRAKLTKPKEPKEATDKAKTSKPARTLSRKALLDLL